VEVELEVNVSSFFIILKLGDEVDKKRSALLLLNSFIHIAALKRYQIDPEVIRRIKIIYDLFYVVFVRACGDHSD